MTIVKPKYKKVSNIGIGNQDTNKPSIQRSKKEVVVTGYSILNGISEKGLIKSQISYS